MLNTVMEEYLLLWLFRGYEDKARETLNIAHTRG